MAKTNLLQKINHILELAVNDFTTRLEENLTQPKTEEILKERKEIIDTIIKISPIAIRLVKILDEEPVEEDYELTPANIELLQDYINEYGTKKERTSH
jgi:hypothetical protein